MRMLLCMRRGFTLIEMLVASGVFLVGFVSIYALFLRGAHDRARGEAITRTSLALASLSVELRLAIADENTVAAPSAHVGDGLAGNGTESGGELYRVDGVPGVWYRVTAATDLTGGDNPAAEALALRLVAIYDSTPVADLTLSDFRQRARIDTGLDEAQAIQELVTRGLAEQQVTVITRRPTWAP